MKKLFSTAYHETSFNIATLVVRCTAGFLMFLHHGIPKLMHFEERRNNFFDPFDLGSQWSLILVIFAEMFCSLLLVFGLFTRLALIPLLVTMSVIVFMANAGKPFAEYELALIYFASFLGLLLTGPGRYSIDAAMGG